MRVVAFTRYGPRAASTRQRFLQYFPALRAAGIEVEHHALLGDDYVASLSSGDLYPRAKVATAYAERIGQLLAAREASLYWVYVELLPYLPAAVERLAAAGKRIVYDFDDAFFHMYDQSGSRFVRRLLSGKHAALLRHAAACACGNAYLLDFAIRHCRKSIILPTVVDTTLYRPRPSGSGQLTVGWIGSPSTWPSVWALLPLLKELVRSYGIRVRVIGAGKEREPLRFEGLEFIEWSEATEIDDVQRMDIGIMPLADQPFERGKSGYKLIQYMACGLPVVASPVGVNREIVCDGENGFLATGVDDWRAALERLLCDANLRRRMGECGRTRAVKQYSLAVHAPRLVELIRAAAGNDHGPPCT
jgi:glycosyltransferase involved in cell wall biosynthesis